MAFSRSFAFCRLARAVPTAAFLARRQDKLQPCLVRQSLVASATRQLSGQNSGDSSHPDTPSSPSTPSVTGPGSMPPQSEPTSSNEESILNFDPTQGSDSEDGHRATILEASLQHVLQLGWTRAALEEGARSIGLSELPQDMFPREGGELIDHFDIRCNSELVDYLLEQNSSEKGPKLLPDAVEMRLRKIVPYIHYWPQAMAIKAFPPNMPSALENLALMVDDMWYCVGDRSTDFNWYTKRALLATIYSSTELYMVQDSSVDFQDTWSFLRRRMEDATEFSKASRELQGVLSGGWDMFSAALSTASSVLGRKSS